MPICELRTYVYPPLLLSDHSGGEMAGTAGHIVAPMAPSHPSNGPNERSLMEWSDYQIDQSAYDEWAWEKNL